MKIYDTQGNLLVAYEPHAVEHSEGGVDEISIGDLAGDISDLSGIITESQHGSPVKCNGDFSSTDMRIRCRTSDPASPADGEIWLRTDL
jgi:hypothetical protein